ncbi:LysE family translocator [Celeribacter neptunius]|uniref:Threonine/homoserine/homoserine lactone efflux protein n=1 Tax=Celeribacter neptunius TaxID=588602 RepID=A0A1I3QTE8_9RHOB|nr:LysE family translocator [Celeribacter neptunius]SFJ37563.1 Threonine/homoserine/homoserine lactone efflux protein [Celeribacter neptunius]
MDHGTWVSFALISAANIMTPGPAILNTVRRAAQLGFRRVQPIIYGNALGLVVAGALCAGGVAGFIMMSDILWHLFRWLGVGYLSWLGVKLLFKREALALPDVATHGVSGGKLFREGFLLAVTNPKAILFFVALFPQVMSPDQPVLPQSVILIGTFCAISIFSLSTYSTLAALLRARFLTERRYRNFRLFSGCLLLGFAGKLAREIR